MADQKKEVEAIVAERRAADLRQHARGAGAERRPPQESRRRLQQPQFLQHERRAPADRQGRRAQAGQTRRRHRPQSRPLRPGQGRLRGPRQARPDRASRPASSRRPTRLSSAAARTSPPGEQARLRQINEELSVLTVKFGENILKENNAFELVIDKDADLARPASRRRLRRGRDGQGPGQAREVGLHAGQAEPHPVPPVLGAPRPAGKDVPGLHHARQQRQRARQQGERRPDRDPPAWSGPTSSATRRTPPTSSRRTWPRRPRRSTPSSRRSGSRPWPGPRPRRPRCRP